MKTIEDLYNELGETKDLLAALSDSKSKIEQEIADLCNLEVQETGSTSTTLDGFKVTMTVPKRVAWDQDELLDAWNYIQDKWGGEPEEYITTKYSVSETAYNSYPTPIKQLFTAARTVKGGKPSIKITKE